MNEATTNADLLQSFEADGFVAFRQFVVGEELSELIANVDRFIKEIII